MNPLPFFTIVIPTYNRADFLPKTLATAFEQSFQDFEVIVINDGSTDNTEGVLQQIQAEHPRLIYKTQPNKERGAARNFGIQLAKGRYITFLDSDDWLYKDYLEYAHQELTRHNFPPFLHTAYEVATPEGKTLMRANTLKSDDAVVLVTGNPLSCLGWFLDREKTQGFGFPEDRAIAGSEDWAFALVLVANFGIKTANHITAALIHHEGRSVLSFDEKKLNVRTKSALEFALQDKKTRALFGQYEKKMVAYRNAYISLHMAISKKRAAALRYLWRAVYAHPSFCLERRFWAILKNLLMRW
jgi:glycosyltransferase involved in cell wall biosynthesis